MSGAARGIRPGGRRERLGYLQLEAGRIRTPGKRGLTWTCRSNDQRWRTDDLHSRNCPQAASQGELAAAHGAGIRLANRAAYGIDAPCACAGAAINGPLVDCELRIGDASGQAKAEC